MPRKRMISPEFWTSDQLCSVSIGANLCFAAFLNFADDEGVHPASPRKLKAEAFGGRDDVTTATVTGWAAELIAVDLWRIFEEGGTRYWYIPTWHKHQKINHPTPSLFPSPPPQTLTDDSRRTHGALPEDSRSAPGGLVPKLGEIRVGEIRVGEIRENSPLTPQGGLGGASLLKPESKPSRKPKTVPSDTVFPPPLDTQEFRACWFDEWLPYRRERGWPQYKPLGLAAVLNDLAKMADPIGAIRYTIAKHYQGIQQPKENNNGKPKHDNRTTRQLTAREIYIRAGGDPANVGVPVPDSG